MELENALEQGRFADMHHAYAILKEEVEEARFHSAIIKETLRYFWDLIKHNEEDAYLYKVNEIRINAYNAITELIQVCAVCEKTIKQLLEEV